MLAGLEDKRVAITNPVDWEAWLDSHLINTARHRKVITEGALMGGLLASGIPVNLSVISDDAGQFNVRYSQKTSNKVFNLYATAKPATPP